ncbi:acyl-CoA thioesterase [Thalassotalea litorea]|uniref:acyl-CoA thioesterase n=1 Tax=Thalassotalea litorea TaxID=2020715 RepID=UPI0037361738
MKTKRFVLKANVIIDVPFHDCDPMRIVWHGNYARYFEVARCELLRKIQYDYIDMDASGYMWPIVDMRIKYVNSAVFTQKINVEAFLVEYESRLKIEYVISDAGNGTILTKGYTIQVAVDKNSSEMLFASPPILLEKLKGYL